MPNKNVVVVGLEIKTKRIGNTPKPSVITGEEQNRRYIRRCKQERNGTTVPQSESAAA
jgi:hypothetical protein